MKKIEHWKIIAFFAAVYDFAVAHISYFMALWLRFDCNYSAIWPGYLDAYFHFITWYAVLAVVVFHFYHMHRIMWRFASFDELVRTVLGSLTASILHIILITAFYANQEEAIRDRVQTMVSTYHPDGAQTVVKDGKYQELMKEDYEQMSLW